MEANPGSASTPAPTRTQRWKARFVSWAKGGFVPEPISRWEWFLMRLLFGAMLVWLFTDWHPFRHVAQDLTWLHDGAHDEGEGQIIINEAGEKEKTSARGAGPLTWVPRAGLYEEFLVIACVLIAAYVLGLGIRFVLPVLALMHMLVWTYHDSQGYTYHGHQMVSIMLMGQAAVAWWKRKQPDAEQRSQLWYYSRGIILAGYITSVVTKIINSKCMWLWNSQYLSVELVKTHRLSYYKNLEPQFAGDPQSATLLLHHPYLAMLLFDVGFFIELFAWVGLRDRKWSCIMGISIIIMHLSIAWLMRLSFTNHQILCLIFLVNVPWLIALAVARVKEPQLTAPQTLP
jgi:hypothetical protein